MAYISISVGPIPETGPQPPNSTLVGLSDLDATLLFQLLVTAAELAMRRRPIEETLRCPHCSGFGYFSPVAATAQPVST